MRPTYIDTLLSNLNSFEKKSIVYHFSAKNISEQLPVSEYVQKHINETNNKVSDIKSNKMLKSRAFNQVTDILTSNYHIHNKGNFFGQDEILLSLKKKILLARVISKSLNQNKTGPFKIFLNTIISEAEKNQVYEILIESLILKKYYFALKESNREFEKIDKQIVYYESCQRRTLFANDCYLKIVINNNLLKFKNVKSFQNYVSRVIRLLKKRLPNIQIRPNKLLFTYYFNVLF